MTEKTLKEIRNKTGGPPKRVEPSTRIVITGVDIPFWGLVDLMIKIAFAAIPVTIVVAIIYAVLLFILAACGSALG